MGTYLSIGLVILLITMIIINIYFKITKRNLGIAGILILLFLIPYIIWGNMSSELSLLFDDKSGSESIQKDLNNVLNLEISDKDAMRIQDSKVKKDDSYNSIVIQESGKDQRVYDAYYRVKDEKVKIYRKSEENKDTYTEVR